MTTLTLDAAALSNEFLSALPHHLFYCERSAITICTLVFAVSHYMTKVFQLSAFEVFCDFLVFIRDQLWKPSFAQWPNSNFESFGIAFLQRVQISNTGEAPFHNYQCGYFSIQNHTCFPTQQLPLVKLCSYLLSSLQTIAQFYADHLKSEYYSSPGLPGQKHHIPCYFKAKTPCQRSGILWWCYSNHRGNR